MATPAPRRFAESPGAVARTVGTLRAALAVLTRLPVASTDESSSGAAAFPLVGAVVGLAGAVPLVAVGSAQPVLASLLAIGVMAVLTGVLHLDGLADTADALAAPYAAAGERARKDPAVGPGGVVALILVVAIQVSALATVTSSAGGSLAAAALVIGAAVARTIPVVAVALAPGRVPADGFAGWFSRRVGPVDAVIAVISVTVLTAVISLAAGSVGLAIGGAAGAIVGVVIAGLIVGLRGQLDGDALGAIVELTLAAALTAGALAS